jgi:hypothetical protein
MEREDLVQKHAMCLDEDKLAAHNASAWYAARRRNRIHGAGAGGRVGLVVSLAGALAMGC